NGRGRVVSGAQTSGSDVQRAGKAFADGAEKIRSQADKIIGETEVTAEKAGKKFEAFGKKYKVALDDLANNIEDFAKNGSKLSEKFGESAKDYQASDEQGAGDIQKVDV